METLIQTECFLNNKGLPNLPSIIISSSEDDTFALGKKIASLLKKGSVIALKGPLGAGKTCFTKGIAKGLGINEEVTSPTYTIISEYESSIPFYHIDAYRLRGDDDFYAIGGEEIIYGGGISVIEWSERIPGFIPAGAYVINFEIIDDNKRRIHICKGNK